MNSRELLASLLEADDDFSDEDIKSDIERSLGGEAYYTWKKQLASARRKRYLFPDGIPPQGQFIKLSNNTILYEQGDQLRIKFHQTDILIADKISGHVVVNSGGWETRTTRERINDFMPRISRQWKICIRQGGFQWYKWSVNGSQTTMPFTDGDYFDSTGELHAQNPNERTIVPRNRR